LRSGGRGEVELTSGVTYSSSNPLMLVINATTGAATALSEGIVTVTSTYGSLSAHSQVTVLGSGNCCADVTVNTIILADQSLSMGQIFASGRSKLLEVYVSCTALSDELLRGVTKDYFAVVLFSDTPTLATDFTNVDAMLWRRWRPAGK
jgi:hypothetical protein